MAGLFYAQTASFGQRAGREVPSRFMEQIDREEGARRLEHFRQQRLKGDFCFEFELEHKPRRARTIRYEGMMWGSWNEIGPVTRFRVKPNLKNSDSDMDGGGAVEIIIQNGTSSGAWIRHSVDEAFKPIEGEALFEPILPGLIYSPFDLQMPFIYWEDFDYAGPDLVGMSRVAQQFLMYPPKNSASTKRGISAVRLGLDDTYNALWRIEVLDTESRVVSQFAVESFKKVEEQYIVKRITLTEYPSKDRTTFDVEAASLGLSLRRQLFDPHAPLAVHASVPEDMKSL